jgi:signal transduction histidine kinase
MSRLSDSYMLNSDLSPPTKSNNHRSRKHQQLAAETNSVAAGRPLYQQAVEKASSILKMPMAVLSVFGEAEVVQASIGLETIAAKSTIGALGIQGCSSYIERSHQCLSINDVELSSQYFDRSELQIVAYLGVPLLTRAGDCLGTLAVMDRVEHRFDKCDQEILITIANWLMCELEREILLKAQVASFFNLSDNSPVVPDRASSIEAEAKYNLLSHLSQSLRTPLTAVLGMTSVLQRELYGPLNEKQQSYMEVVHHSGVQLMALVDEITNLVGQEQLDHKLTMKATDIEMLCQQSIRDLESALKQRRQHVELILTSPSRIWLIDRDKVRQIIYYLLLHTMSTAAPGETIGLHVATHANRLTINIEPLPSRNNVSNLRVLPTFNHNSNHSSNHGLNMSVDSTHTQLGLILGHILAEIHNGTLEQVGKKGHCLSLPLIAGALEEVEEE